MNSKCFSKGDILQAIKRGIKEGLHYIVYYEGNSDSDFLGFMITTSKEYNNIPMIQSHFIDEDSNGNVYKIRYNDSYLVKGKFLKPEIWGEFTKVGQLSEEGINFIEQEVGGIAPKTFEEYKIQNNIN